MGGEVSFSAALTGIPGMVVGVISTNQVCMHAQLVPLFVTRGTAAPPGSFVHGIA